MIIKNLTASIYCNFPTYNLNNFEFKRVYLHHIKLNGQTMTSQREHWPATFFRKKKWFQVFELRTLVRGKCREGKVSLSINVVRIVYSRLDCQSGMRRVVATLQHHSSPSLMYSWQHVHPYICLVKSPVTWRRRVHGFTNCVLSLLPTWLRICDNLGVTFVNTGELTAKQFKRTQRSPEFKVYLTGPLLIRLAVTYRLHLYARLI